MDAASRAQAVVTGADASADELQELARVLRDDGQTSLVGEMLTAVARRALYGDWRPDEHAARLIDVLRDHQQFSYARRLLGRLRATNDCERLRQQHAVCTYKDLELAAGVRLDRALRILEQSGPLSESTDADTLGIAGAIHKRRWDVDARRADLETALFYYLRGFEQADDPSRWYAGVNAAFVADRLAALEDTALVGSGRSEALREQATHIRTHIAEHLVGGDRGWDDATLGEALFGLRRFDEARERLTAVASSTKELWRRETIAMQIAALAQLRGMADAPGTFAALESLVGGRAGHTRVEIGKVGLALSGGGFRASLFHIGVLARLAECNVLRRIEVLSCVSGGSILGAFYYLKLQQLLERKSDGDVTDADYVTLVREVADEFLAGVRGNLRGRLVADRAAVARMLLTRYSRSDRAAELYEQLFYGPLRDRKAGPWRMPDLLVRPHGSGGNFSLRYENWMRAAKVPILVLNATTLNTGHNWQFTATWMGEPQLATDQRTDASRRLRRVDYGDAPDRDELREPRLGMAVAASACVPGLFAPITLPRLYESDVAGLEQGIDVELVDGGVHDNQGVASLLEEDCNVILISDASGQLPDDEDPKRGALGVMQRSNGILMKRVRGAQYAELRGRRRSGTVRGYMAVHLTMGLTAPPRDWSDCQEPWSEEDAWPGDQGPAYGLDAGVQRAMAELRTDLDAFSDDEAYTLMAAGYLMTTHDLAGALPHLATPDPALVLGEAWPFAAALAEMTSPDATRLAAALRPGRDLFFRRPRAWLRHGRAVGRTVLAGLPRLGRGPST